VVEDQRLIEAHRAAHRLGRAAIATEKALEAIHKGDIRFGDYYAASNEYRLALREYRKLMDD
jgi:hypothetical protein